MKPSTLVKEYSYILIIICFFIYCFLNIKKQGFWHDEIYTLSFMRGIDVYLFDGSDIQSLETHTTEWYKALLAKDNFWTNFWRNIEHEGHPPFYYIFLKLWSYVFGYDEIGLRSFSLFTSCITLFVSFKIGKQFSSRYATLLTLLLSISPTFIFYSLEARSYSLYMLCSVTCLYYFVKEFRNYRGNISKINVVIPFITASTLLLYTHYYGMLLYVSLIITALIGWPKKLTVKRITVLISPIIIFAFWIPFILKQTSVHKSHWTNGYLGFTTSSIEFGKGLLDLFSFTANGNIQYISISLLFAAVAGVVISWIINKRPKSLILMTTMIYVLVVGLVIIFFDLLMNHHTIAIPRYYYPLEFVLIFLLFMLLVNGKSFVFSTLSFVTIFILLIKVDTDVNSLKMNPKQMYREVAWYISSNFNPAETKLFITPNGPTTIGIAYYLQKNFQLTSMNKEYLCEKYHTPNALTIEQRLGLNFEAWTLPCKSEVQEKRIIRFVGVDVTKPENYAF